MFLSQNIKINNGFEKYIIGSLIVFFASLVGQFPLVIVMFYQAYKNGYDIKNIPDPMKILEPNLMLFLMLLSFVVAMYALYLVIKHFHKQTFISVTTARPKVDWKRVMFSFGLWGGFTIISVTIGYYAEPENFVWNFKLIPFLILFVIAVLLIPIQTSVEEYLFRGYLMQGFAELSRNRWFPLMMTSIIFGSMHILNPEIEKLGYIMLVYYIGTGLLLGIITLMDDGMELALGFHAANNLVGCLLVTTDWTALQTHSLLKDISEPIAGLDVILPIVLIYPLLIYVFSVKYKWTNWKEKLTGNIQNHQTLDFLKTNNKI